MSMPVQKPGKSKQDYCTPAEFVARVDERFGRITFDLAANAENKVYPRYFGPGSPLGENSLQQDWSEIAGLLWLNPPYADIAPWAKKCSEEANRGCEILLLVPASVGANWFWDYVAPFADVYCLSPRLSFDGKHPYPKDLILAHYWQRNSSDTYLERWRWK